VDRIRRRLAIAWLRGYGRRIGVPSGVVEALIAAEDLRPGRFDTLRVERELYGWFDRKQMERYIR
jgi:hypothetical protein